MSARSVAMKWGVPRTTLQNCKKAGFRNVGRPGPATILTPDEETALCDWLVELSRRGIPVQKKFLLDSMGQLKPSMLTLLVCLLVKPVGQRKPSMSTPVMCLLIKPVGQLKHSMSQTKEGC